MKRYNLLGRLPITIVAVILLGLVALPMQARADAEQDKPAFSDVPRGHWAYNAVQRLAQAGIIEGYPLNTEQQANSASGSTLNDANAASVVRAGTAANAALAGSLINVDTTSTSVMLSGTVKSQVQKVLAEQIAKRKAGNLKVINHLKIVGPSKR